MRKLTQSIRLRLTLFFVAVTTLTLGGFGIYSRQQLSNDLESQFTSVKLGVANRLAVNMPGALWNLDIAIMEQIVASEISPPEVRAIFVEDSRSYTLVGLIKSSDGKLIKTLDQAGATGERLSTPIYRGVSEISASGAEAPKPDGHVVVLFSRDPIDQALRSNLRNLVLQILLVNLVLLIFLTLGLRLVFRPLARLRDAQFALAHQQSEKMTALPPIHLTELDELTDGFNQTMAKLKLVIEMRTAAEATAVAATSETRAVLDKLVTTQEELVKAGKLAALGRLVAGIAHELNTPIGNGLMAASSLFDHVKDLKAEMADKGLKRSSLESFLADAESGMGITMNSLTRSASLVSRFKQIAMNKGTAHKGHFDVDQLIGHVLDSMGDLLSAANCRVEHDVSECLEIDSDPDLLGQVISSLVSNAFIHGFSGRPGGVIKIHAERDGNNVTICVRDDGVGIPSENLSKVFDPFFTTRLGKGESGLGLYVANNIVTDVLGGRLSVISQIGVGTEFTINLPMVLSVSQS